MKMRAVSDQKDIQLHREAQPGYMNNTAAGTKPEQ